jgi:hypothetical protein
MIGVVGEPAPDFFHVPPQQVAALGEHERLPQPRPRPAGSLPVHQEPAELPGLPVQVPHPHPAQLRRPDPRDISDLRHRVVAAGHQFLPRAGQRSPPLGEELPQRPPRRRHPQPEITPVRRPVERIDRRLHRAADPPGDLPAIPLLQEREIAVDPVQLLAHRRPGPLARPGEVPVDMPGSQPPRDQPEVLAHLDHRPCHLVQRRGRQPGHVTRPLVLRQRVREEQRLIVCQPRARTPAPQRQHVGQSGLDVRNSRGRPVRDGRRWHDRQYATPRIPHDLREYWRASRISRATPGILDGTPTAVKARQAGQCGNIAQDKNAIEPARAPVGR